MFLEVRWTLYIQLCKPTWTTQFGKPCNKQFTIVLRDCLEALHSKEAFDGCPYRDIPAVKVPMNHAGIITSGAFLAVPRVRHVSVEAGIREIGAEAWQCCRHLRVVRMPSTVVRIAENTFRGCQLLTIASQYQAALIWGSKHSRTVVLYSGSMPTEEELTTLVVQPNLDTTFLPSFSRKMAAIRSNKPRTKLGNCRLDACAPPESRH